MFLCTRTVDMRLGPDGLSGLVSSYLGENPLSGHLFIFKNKRGDRLKLLYWDRDGWALWYKRLEKGTFRFPLQVEGSAEIDQTTLMMILQGVDLKAVRRRKRYIRTISA
jgi:transposase